MQVVDIYIYIYAKSLQSRGAIAGPPKKARTLP